MKKIIIAMLLCVVFALPVYAGTPTRDTDVTTPASGNVLVTVRGAFHRTSKETVLKRINEIRYEACEQGVLNPSTNKKLTLSDYNPIKWSSDLEWIAQTRAAEASVVEDHTRPNGTLCFTCKHNGVQTWAEDLAWNGKGLMSGIEQWYSEKEAWVKQTSGAVTGHYTSMIDPSYNYVGIGCFILEKGGWYTVAGEFSFMTGLNEGQIGVAGVYDQKIEVPQKDKEKYAQYAGKGDKVVKQAQPMTVKASKKTVKFSKLKKKAQTIKPITVKSAQGTVTYKITGGNKKSKKVLKINLKNGKITVKKKTKKGTYKVKVTVYASGNDNYNAGSKTVNVKVVVK